MAAIFQEVQGPIPLGMQHEQLWTVIATLFIRYESEELTYSTGQTMPGINTSHLTSIYISAPLGS